jgi:hypothetical protein
MPMDEATQTRKRKASDDVKELCKNPKPLDPFRDSFFAPKEFPFFRLPRELGDEIYDHAFGNVHLRFTEDWAIVTASYGNTQILPDDCELYCFPKWRYASKAL